MRMYFRGAFMLFAISMYYSVTALFQNYSSYTVVSGNHVDKSMLIDSMYFLAVAIYFTIFIVFFYEYMNITSAAISEVKYDSYGNIQNIQGIILNEDNEKIIILPYLNDGKKVANISPMRIYKSRIIEQNIVEDIKYSKENTKKYIVEVEQIE